MKYLQNSVIVFLAAALMMFWSSCGGGGGSSSPPPAPLPTAQVAIGGVPLGNHNLCLLVDVDQSGLEALTPGDLFAQKGYNQTAAGNIISVQPGNFTQF